MKIQDVGFFVVLIALFLLKKPRLFVWTGLGCLVLAIPLFAKWIFFTAERLTWYASVFFLVFILISLRDHSRVK